MQVSLKKNQTNLIINSTSAYSQSYLKSFNGFSLPSIYSQDLASSVIWIELFLCFVKRSSLLSLVFSLCRPIRMAKLWPKVSIKRLACGCLGGWFGSVSDSVLAQVVILSPVSGWGMGVGVCLRFISLPYSLPLPHPKRKLKLEGSYTGKWLYLDRKFCLQTHSLWLPRFRIKHQLLRLYYKIADHLSEITPLMFPRTTTLFLQPGKPRSI